MDLTRIYKCIPYLLILLSIGALAYFVATGKSAYLFNNGAIIFIAALVIGSLIIILAKKNHPESISLDGIACLNLPQRTLRRCFLIVASTLLIVVLLGFRNSCIYIIFLILACVCIILQILSKNVSAPWTIFEILYLAGILIFPFIFAYPYYYSDSDIIYHTYFAQTIIDTGFMNTLAASGEIYASFPGYHLILAASSLISALPANVCDYVFLKIGYLCLSIFVYLLAKQFFPSKTAGLLALFIYLIGTFATPRYTWGQPSILLAALALMLLYLVFRKKKYEKILPFIILAIPVVLFAIISHHANNLPLIGILFVILLTDVLIIPLISRHKNWREHSTNISIILLYLLPCMAYLWYAYLPSILWFINKIVSSIGDTVQTILAKVIGAIIPSAGASPLTLAGEAVQTIQAGSTGEIVNALSSTFANSDILSIIYKYASYSHIWLCIIPALVGMYFLLTGHKRSRKQYLTGFIMLVFFILFCISDAGIPGLTQLNTYRFYNIIAALFMGGIVFGLLYLANPLQHRFKRKHLSQCVVGIFCLLLLASPCVTFAAENDVLQPLKIVQNNPSHLASAHFSEEDMAMFDTIKGILPTDKQYTSDNRALRYINTFVSDAKTGYSSSPSAIGMNDIFTKDCISDNSYQKYETVFFREKQFLERGIYSFDDYATINYLATPERILLVCWNLHKHNTVYANGDDGIYVV